VRRAPFPPGIVPVSLGSRASLPSPVVPQIIPHPFPNIVAHTMHLQKIKTVSIPIRHTFVIENRTSGINERRCARTRVMVYVLGNIQGRCPSLTNGSPAGNMCSSLLLGLWVKPMLEKWWNNGIMVYTASKHNKRFLFAGDLDFYRFS